MINEIRYPNESTSVRHWYQTEYPADSRSQEIFDTVTFLDIYTFLVDGGDVYGVTGTDDQEVIDRILEGLDLAIDGAVGRIRETA